MRIIIIALSLLLIVPCAYAQILSGSVYDLVTKLPVKDVHVYLDGTSYQTTTNADGKFELLIEKKINTSLIFRHLSYHTESIPDPFEKDLSKIYLEEQVDSIREVVIQTDRYSRKQKMKAFREQFLGMNKAGRSCRILNEDDIQLFYNANTGKLSATADQPLVIENKYLGYSIQFNLISFEAYYGGLFLTGSSSAGHLGNNSIRFSLFLGTSLFTDLEPNNKMIKKRREIIYTNSPRNFFKNLSQNTLEASHHRVFHEGFLTDPHTLFSIKDTLPIKQVRINEGIKPLKWSETEYIYLKMSVLHKRDQSDIYFLTNAFSIDPYGNTNMVDKIRFTGEFGQQRIGNMLPLEYDIDSNIKTTNTDRLSFKEADPGQLFQQMIAPYQGKVIYLNFWETSCGPCRAQMAYMNTLRETLKEKDVVFMHLAVNSPENTWKNLITKMKLTGENVVHYRLSEEQQLEMENRFPLDIFPTYMLIDRSGKTIYTDVVPPTEKEAITQRIEELLNQ
ncbi:MAG: redoxin family protein [Bacteroidales bacterium]|jgi:thiol-disulfide isomerase/thioredoxin|nr:redoxin family protein [Bacteroidales bacterium]